MRIILKRNKRAGLYIKYKAAPKTPNQSRGTDRNKRSAKSLLGVVLCTLYIYKGRVGCAWGVPAVFVFFIQ